MLLLACQAPGASGSATTIRMLPPVPQKCEEAGGGDPGAVVVALYGLDWDKLGPDTKQYRETLQRYFDEHLTGLFIQDYECQLKYQGVCRLDFSVTYHSQDQDVSELRICAYDRKKGEVLVTFRNAGQPQSVRYLLRSTREGWRIHDVRYADGKTLSVILSRRL